MFLRQNVCKFSEWQHICEHTLSSTHLQKQVFQVKKLVGLLPQLELLAVFSRKSGYDNTSKQCNHMQKLWAHTVSLRHGHTDTDRLCIHYPFWILLHLHDMLPCPDLRLKTASSSRWGSSPTIHLTRNTCLYTYIRIYTISVTRSHTTGAKWKQYRGCHRQPIIMFCSSVM